MPDHRDGPRLVNALFPVVQQLPARQQAVFVALMGGGISKASGFADDKELAAEVEEARAHFHTKLGSLSGPS